MIIYLAIARHRRCICAAYASPIVGRRLGYRAAVPDGQGGRPDQMGLHPPIVPGGFVFHGRVFSLEFGRAIDLEIDDVVSESSGSPLPTTGRDGNHHLGFQFAQIVGKLNESLCALSYWSWSGEGITVLRPAFRLEKDTGLRIRCDRPQKPSAVFSALLTAIPYIRPRSMKTL